MKLSRAKVFCAISTAIISIGLTGCSNVNLQTAQEIADKEKNKCVRNLSKYRDELNAEKSEKPSKNASVGSAPSSQVNENDNKKIRIVNMGESVKIEEFEINVIDVINADNVNEVSKLTDDERSGKLKDMLLADFGPESRMAKVKGTAYIQEDGSLSGSFNNMLFIKVNIKNTGRRREICMNPYIYSVTDSNDYAYESSLEVLAMDNVAQLGNDWAYYTFDTGQEEEFVLAFVARKSIEDKKLCLSTRFLTLQTSFNPTSIPDGEVFIKLFKENETCKKALN